MQAPPSRGTPRCSSAHLRGDGAPRAPLDLRRDEHERRAERESHFAALGDSPGQRRHRARTRSNSTSPEGGVQSIQLTSPLPPIVNSVVIDGTTQPNYQSSPLIQLDGSQARSGSNGLVISAGDSTVEGLAIVGFSGSAIVFNSLGGNVVAGNYLGVTASGNQAEANGAGITVIGSSANTIGGSTAAAERDLGQQRQRHRDRSTGAAPQPPTRSWRT